MFSMKPRLSKISSVRELSPSACPVSQEVAEKEKRAREQVEVGAKGTRRKQVRDQRRLVLSGAEHPRTVVELCTALVEYPHGQPAGREAREDVRRLLARGGCECQLSSLAWPAFAVRETHHASCWSCADDGDVYERWLAVSVARSGAVCGWGRSRHGRGVGSGGAARVRDSECTEAEQNSEWTARARENTLEAEWGRKPRPGVTRRRQVHSSPANRGKAYSTPSTTPIRRRFPRLRRIQRASKSPPRRKLASALPSSTCSALRRRLTPPLNSSLIACAISSVEARPSPVAAAGAGVAGDEDGSRDGRKVRKMRQARMARTRRKMSWHLPERRWYLCNGIGSSHHEHASRAESAQDFERTSLPAATPAPRPSHPYSSAQHCNPRDPAACPGQSRGWTSP